MRISAIPAFTANRIQKNTSPSFMAKPHSHEYNKVSANGGNTPLKAYIDMVGESVGATKEIFVPPREHDDPYDYVKLLFRKGFDVEFDPFVEDTAIRSFDVFSKENGHKLFHVELDNIYDTINADIFRYNKDGSIYSKRTLVKSYDEPEKYNKNLLTVYDKDGCTEYDGETYTPLLRKTIIGGQEVVYKPNQED